MLKKISLYFGLILLASNLVNGNLLKLYLFLKQKILINSINPEIENICYPLQEKIETYIYDFRDNISISVLTDDGKFIVNVNGFLPRIPASNQKILTSAFSLDNLGPEYTLNTSLQLLSDGSLYINASGDPDFGVSHLSDLVGVLNSKKNLRLENVPILITNINSSDWWPSGWSDLDRTEKYGAPIISYSISSNASRNALNNPIYNFRNKLETVLRFNKLSSRFFVQIVNQDYPVNPVSTLNTINSAPLYVLLSLVNSESHNFTSEVIFRHSIDDWSHDFPNIKYTKWLNQQNFSSDKFIFKDASGLSRKNRVTTYGLSQFLRRMKNNRYSDYYFSSFSILGLRGSLAKVKAPKNLKGNILAKSGTLNNVRSLSGLILGKDQFFSIIVNNMDDSMKYIIDILSIIDKNNCK